MAFIEGLDPASMQALFLDIRNAVVPLVMERFPDKSVSVVRDDDADADSASITITIKGN